MSEERKKRTEEKGRVVWYHHNIIVPCYDVGMCCTVGVW